MAKDKSPTPKDAVPGKSAKPPAKTKAKSADSKPAAAKPGKQRGLGRGLSALMEDVNLDAVVSEEPITRDPISSDPIPSEPIKSKPIKSKPVASDPVSDGYDAPDIIDDIIDIDIDPPAELTPPSQREPQAKASPSPAPSASTAFGLTTVSMDQIVRNPDQPRKVFDADALEELAGSIQRQGVLQPILVRPVPERESGNTVVPMYQIVAGERRWQAAGKAGVPEMPVLIRSITDEEALEIGVIENVQRKDLSPIEEANAYNALLHEFGRTQEEVANAIGKSRSHVANTLRLLTLPLKVQGYIAEGKLSSGHARTLIGSQDPSAMADMIVDKGMSVRDAERTMKALKSGNAEIDQYNRIRKYKSPDTLDYEEKLSLITGLKVDLRHRGPGGEVRFKYSSPEHLEKLFDLIAGFKFEEPRAGPPRKSGEET